MTRRVPAVAVVLGLLLVSGGAAPVLADVSLVESAPAAGSTVSGVDVVTLAFDEALRKSVSSFTLIGPDGSTLGTGTASAPRRMTLGGLVLGPGEHTVRWTAAGDDGHIERGRFSFTVEAAAVTPSPAAVNPSPSTGPPDGPATASQPIAKPSAASPAGTAAVASAAAPGATASQAVDPASSTATDVLVPIVAGLAIVGLVGLLVLRRSRTA
jgi:methionine-rich copper-binding protein CopC